MIENKSIGSKVFDVVNVVILILITLVCILPVWYVLCVSLSSREAVSAGKVALWPVGFNLLSYKKILGEGNFFTSFLVSIKRVVLGTGQHGVYTFGSISVVKNKKTVSEEGHLHVDLCILHAFQWRYCSVVYHNEELRSHGQHMGTCLRYGASGFQRHSGSKLFQESAS